MNRRWGITRSSSSYMFQYVATSYYTMKPADGAVYSGMDVVTSSASPQYCWSLEWYSSVSNQVLLINSELGLPANGAVRYVEPGRTFTLNTFKLMAVFVSKNTVQQDIRWSTDNPEVATVNSETGTVTIRNMGIAQITATQVYNGVSYSKAYTIVVNGDVRFYCIPSGSHDHITALETSRNNILSKYPNTYTAINASVMTVAECKVHLQSCKIFASRSHGNHYINAETGLVDATIANLNGLTEVLWSNPYPGKSKEGTTLEDGEDYSNLNLVLFISCYSGRGGIAANNLPSKIVEHGAKVAIGFEGSIDCKDANNWTEMFFDLLVSGKTVFEAARDASKEFGNEDNNLLFGDVVIVGAENLRLSDLL